MAFPLTFCDEHGRLTRYPWSEYPVVVARGPTVELRWDDEPYEPKMMSPVRIRVYCGPPAPFPAEPTAETFRAGVEMWLYR